MSFERIVSTMNKPSDLSFTTIKKQLNKKSIPQKSKKDRLADKTVLLADRFRHHPYKQSQEHFSHIHDPSLIHLSDRIRNRVLNALKENNMKQRYTTQTSLRLSEDLRNSIDTVCDKWNVNPSDYIRRSVAHHVQNDLAEINNGDTKIVFI